jgi:CheY-like chemotaxis protein
MSYNKNNAYNILLVEDNEGDVILLKENFSVERTPHILHSVQDGEQALDFLKKQGNYVDAVTPDLVLLDINIPRINGLDFLSRVKKDQELSQIPMMILSSSKSDRDVDAAKENGAIGFIVKGAKYSLPDLITYASAIKDFPGMWIKIAA